MVVTVNVVQKSVCRGEESDEGSNRLRPRGANKLCYLVALTFGRLRWRGAVLAVGADSKRGCRAQVSIRSCEIDMRDGSGAKERNGIGKAG